MALRFNPFTRPNNDTGFGTTTTGFGGRFLNRDGTFNIRREGVSFYERISVYNYLLKASRSTFLLFTFAYLFTVNLLYTGIYLLGGYDGLTGYNMQGTWANMREVFYFSCQTFTTVGYGDLHPVSDFANIVASIEAMNGWLTFALFTGLIYGRFARPRPHLRFSEKAVVAPYRGITGLMFRFVSTKESHTLTNVQVTVSLGLQVNENGSPVYRFYDLPLERNHVDSLPMNFTVVHPIDEQSPLWGYSAADLQEADVELFVLVQAFDDVYNATVQQRTSYTFDEIRVGEKFVPMFRESNDKNTTILEVQKLSVVVSAPVTQPVA